MSAVDVRSDKLGRLVDENVEVKQLGTGFTFTEGPVWNPQGQFLLFSDMPGDTRRRWDEQGGVEVVASPSNKGNGMTLDADGRCGVRALDQLASSAWTRTARTPAARCWPRTTRARS